MSQYVQVRSRNHECSRKSYLRTPAAKKWKQTDAVGRSRIGRRDARMTTPRVLLEAEFMRLCLAHGPSWIESVVRPLRLPGARIAARDIPEHALRSIVGVFGSPARSLSRATSS
jgi:hypothetical protein